MPAPRKSKRIAIIAGIGVAVVAVMIGMEWDRIAAWYRFRQMFESIGKNEQGKPEYRHRLSEIIMVSLPGGTFTMGSPESEAERDEREIQHEVTLSPFLIAKFEVSQAEWKRVMGDNPSTFQGDDLVPVDVSWDDCKKFCEKLGLRLPTEAEWEYACRAGTDGPYAGSGVLVEMGWYAENSGQEPHPVGEKKPNDFGLHDMHGNVWEWCEDVWDPEFYSKPESRQKDPLCTSGSDARIFRGGSRGDYARNHRCAFRHGALSSERFFFRGFRPSMSFR